MGYTGGENHCGNTGKKGKSVFKLALAVVLVSTMSVSACAQSAGTEPAPVATVTVTVGPQPDSNVGAFDKEACDTIQLMYDVNKRLYNDGYQDSYLSEYRSFIRFYNCPGSQYSE